MNVGPRPRRNRRIGLFLIAALIAVPAGFAVAGLLRHYENQPWTIAGTADGGKALVINLSPTFSDCAHGPKISVIKQTRRQVQIRTRAADGRCSSKVGRMLGATVTLDEPLAGRAITGPLAQGVNAHPYGPPRMPDVTGLAPATAETLARSLGLETFAIQGPHGTGAAVTSQTPPAGTLFPDFWPEKHRRATRVTLNTKQMFKP